MHDIQNEGYSRTGKSFSRKKTFDFLSNLLKKKKTNENDEIGLSREINYRTRSEPSGKVFYKVLYFFI